MSFRFSKHKGFQMKMYRNKSGRKPPGRELMVLHLNSPVLEVLEGGDFLFSYVSAGLLRASPVL